MKKANKVLEQNKRELLPSSLEERNVSLGGYFAMWIGMAVIIATYALGGSGIESISLGWLIFACLIANVICGIFITLSGDIGVEHGVPFPLYLRVTFGPVGSALPSLIRGLLACCWTGIQTYYGATALSFIVAYFTGFDNWFVCYVVFLAAQIINAMFGVDAIEKFAFIAAPSIIAISIWIVYNLVGVAQENAIDLWHSIYVPGSGAMFATKGVAFSVFIATVSTNMSYWSTSAADTQSLTKYVKVPAGERNWFRRNRNCLCAHLIALPVVQTFCIVIGALSTLSYGKWNPIEALQETASGIGLVILMLLILLAQWSTNTAASILPGAMTFMNIVKMLFKKNMPFKAGVVIVGIIALCSFPWEIMVRFGGFMNVMGSAYGPICGVFMADYYVLRRRRLNVPDLYREKDGQYYYAGGWNIPGIIALVCGVAGGLTFGGFSFLVSITVAFVIYFVLAKVWWFRMYPQAEISSGYDEKFLGISNNNLWQDLDVDLK